MFFIDFRNLLYFCGANYPIPTQRERERERESSKIFGKLFNFRLRTQYLKVVFTFDNHVYLWKGNMRGYTFYYLYHTVIPLWIYRIPSELRSQAGLGLPSTVVGDHTGIVGAVCFCQFKVVSTLIYGMEILRKKDHELAYICWPCIFVREMYPTFIDIRKVGTTFSFRFAPMV